MYNTNNSQNSTQLKIDAGGGQKQEQLATTWDGLNTRSNSYVHGPTQYFKRFCCSKQNSITCNIQEQLFLCHMQVLRIQHIQYYLPSYRLQLLFESQLRLCYFMLSLQLYSSQLYPLGLIQLANSDFIPLAMGFAISQRYQSTIVNLSNFIQRTLSYKEIAIKSLKGKLRQLMVALLGLHAQLRTQLYAKPLIVLLSMYGQTMIVTVASHIRYTHCMDISQLPTPSSSILWL